MICNGKTKLTVNEESENQYGLDETVSDFDKELELLKEKQIAKQKVNKKENGKE